MGHRAAAAARPGPVAEGNVGAGTGATVGKLHGIARATKGGLGCAVIERDGVHVGALVAVNAVGDVRDPDTGRLIAGARDAADGLRLIDTAAALAAGARPPAFRPVNTTIGLLATTAALDKLSATRLARLAMDGFAQALSPPHLSTDGDTLFCLSVGTARADVDALGRDAAPLVARAIVRGVRAATAAAGLPAARDLE
jgi:L-aminopeptidase/D-esterase-like protein